MTIKEITESDKTFLTATDIAAVLEVDAASIRSQAQEDPRKLGFNVIVIGSRVKIPRLAFLAFLKNISMY